MIVIASVDCGCKSIRKYGTTSNDTTKHIEQKDIDVRFKSVLCISN